MKTGRTLHMRRAAGAENVDETARGDEDGGKSVLTRAITGPLLFVFILGDVLGAGIYALVGVIAGEVGGAVWVPLLVALVMALLTATSYAELVTKYPRAGGAAVFAQRAYRKPLISFLVGFSMLAAGVTSAAGLALAFSGDYLKAFIDVPTVPAALVFLLVVGLLNARGIKESMRANVVMTVVEVTGLVLVVVLACIVLGRGDGTLSRVVEFDDSRSPALAVLAAALLAYYSFVGFETSANVAEEVKNVSKVYPRALFGALLTAGAAYVLVGLAVSVVLPADELAASSGPLLEVVSAADVGVPPRLFSLIALVAVANGALPPGWRLSRPPPSPWLSASPDRCQPWRRRWYSCCFSYSSAPTSPSWFCAVTQCNTNTSERRSSSRSSLSVRALRCSPSRALRRGYAHHYSWPSE
jgi:APA family basic amino acid/polyamine antiporter